MSAPICVLLEATGARVEFRGSPQRGRDVPWSADAPDALADALRAFVDAPSSIVVVVGLGLLEIARPELPPMPDAARRAMLWRDADRYFPLQEPVALVCVDGFALALPSRRLHAWVQALRSVGPVRAIVTTPQVGARLVGTGARTLAAGDAERGLIDARDGELQTVRRVLHASSPASMANATSSTSSPGSTGSTSNTPRVPTTTATASPVLSSVDLARAGLRWLHAPLTAQLLDTVLTESLRSARRLRWIASAGALVAALLLLLWSANNRMDAVNSSLEQNVGDLTRLAEPATNASVRLARAQREIALLARIDSAQRAVDALLPVLAELTRILPRDAVVQRLEWNGERWRVEGTADNARRLVPLLDGDARFRDVRIAAASTRFLDIGRQRESFSIDFRTRPATGGAHAP